MGDGPTIDDVRACTAPGADEASPLRDLLWGPVPQEEAMRCGVHVSAVSLLFRVDVCAELRSRVLALIPAEVLPQAGDTRRSLTLRLATSDWLDDIHFLRKGKGPGYPRLNETTYPQPRRVTWSVLADEPFLDGDGDLVYPLFVYTQYGRRPDDFRCRPMPMDVFELCIALWRAAWPFLGRASQQQPPTSCQLLLCTLPA